MSVKFGELVLVRDGVVAVVGLVVVRLANRDLDAAEVWREGQDLFLESSKLHDATGAVEIRVTLPDAEAWLGRLVARGAKLRAA